MRLYVLSPLRAILPGKLGWLSGGFWVAIRAQGTLVGFSPPTPLASAFTLFCTMPSHSFFPCHPRRKCLEKIDMHTTPLELSILICTRNRAASLKLTLDCLLASYRVGLPIEIVIADNGSQDETPHLVDTYKQRLPIRYLREEREGKVYCLNRTLDEGGPGRIIAEIDDDISVEPDWIQGVLAGCKRRPDVDIFGGHVYIIWPPGPIPLWAKQCRSDVRGWAFSAYSNEKHVPKGDRPIWRDRWPCGNHFWFRSKLLKPNSRFADLWETAPGLLFDFVERGAKAIVCTDIVAGHRIQPQLLDETFICK